MVPGLVYVRNDDTTMPKSHPHSKGSSPEPAGEPRAPADAEVSAADLRAQVAILADQVRRLSEGGPDRSDADRANARNADALRVDAWFALTEDPLAADPPLPTAPLPRDYVPPQPQPQAAQPAQADPTPGQAAVGEAAVGEGAVGEAAVGEAEAAGAEGGAFADTSTHLVASVVALAELAAIELRTSAEIEAAAIRAQSRQRPDEATGNHLLVLLERQRRMLAALAAQAERIERAGAVIRAQILALEAEREHIYELLAAERQAP